MPTAIGIARVLSSIYACDTEAELRRYWSSVIGVTYKNLPEVIAAKDKRKEAIK